MHVIKFLNFIIYERFIKCSGSSDSRFIICFGSSDSRFIIYFGSSDSRFIRCLMYQIQISKTNCYFLISLHI
jgi:hypothetical protein